jgi:hypothetical protein
MPQSLNIGGFMATHLEINQYSAFVGIVLVNSNRTLSLESFRN